jgi:hypothetical protein
LIKIARAGDESEGETRAFVPEAYDKTKTLPAVLHSVLITIARDFYTSF